ncbi:two-component GAP Cdc16 [Schizosaccharomyces japonicus yFS275]|uniref:Two-component GAP Cdc16 n=1 Tax=Schizosaccharomyces japonicus (strain yFS275 / FY16936) TaxID=402676 RepID=B6JXS5_SCHJY|nr:two-component GAP Cdc16 [Schizosaccharomyces japonicus yFS275]EEB06343.1 two-component GAP Cdc16 [Schizosaccharomyces japonicus yFS275]
MGKVGYKHLLSLRPKSKEDQQNAISTLRRDVMLEQVEAETDGTSTTRAYIWSIFLHSRPKSSEEYIRYVRQGPSPLAEKIRNDVSRTLVTDTFFHTRVSQSSLSRVLNVYVWKKGTTYVQGMNVLAAPFLYVCKSESQSYYMFEKLLQHECPLYVVPNLDGVHRGLKLLDKCLELLDTKLYAYLISKGLPAKLYAFPSILTLSACTAPLSEVLKLWDFLFAYGVHLNVLCVIAQLLVIRDELISHPKPMKLLRKFPPLNAKDVIRLTVLLITKIPRDLFDLLVRHCWDPDVGVVIDRL